MEPSSDSTGAILFDLTDQLLADVSAGRLHPLAHYLARFPGHEEHVAREYLTLMGRQVVSEARDPVAREPGGVGDAKLESASAGRTEERADRQSRIGPFRIVSLLGRGGQGVVYRAEDVRLARTVALKVLSLTLASVSHGRRSRFRREAAIVSRLDHPGICTILDADLDGDTPYIAMRYVEGETLGVALARARELRAQGDRTPSTQTSTSASRLLAPRRALELSEALTFFERAARALHAAHEAGVVHRDVKPGNIMVSTDGSPVILDFGLARGADEESAQLTRSDEVFGTPAYISPEQLDSGHHVDRRTDVYSLGVVLYECLTLERPFQGENGTQLAEAIRKAPVKPPAALNPAVPHDLEVVLETALERDVERRYPTALELAEELRRVREYEPIRARPAGPLLRLTRWAQRNPVLATGTIGSIAALSIALVIALVLLGRVQEEQHEKEAALHLYEAGYYRDQASAVQNLWPVRALHYAIAAAELEPGFASNRVLLEVLEGFYQKQALLWPSGLALHFDIAPDGKGLLSAAEDGQVRLWEPETGREIARFEAGAGTVSCVHYSPDGARFAAAFEDGKARIWRVADPRGKPLELTGHERQLNWAEFSPDGARVVTAGRDHTARIWDATSGAELLRLEGHTGNVNEARYVADGRWILTRSAEPLFVLPAPESDHTVRLFDARTGEPLCEILGHTDQVRSAELSPDGAWLATGSADHTARLYRIDDDTPLRPEPVRRFDAPGKFHSVAFSPDSRRLALAFDAGARVVDVETGATLYDLQSHDRRAVVWTAFSPDGGRIATVAYDNAVRIFRASDGAPLRVCRGDTRTVQTCAWSPDGSWIAACHRRPEIHLWYADERPFLQVLRGHTGEVVSARFDGDARRVLTASKDGTARLWSALDGTLLRVVDPGVAERMPLIGARFDRSGERILLTDDGGGTTLVAVRDPPELRRLATASRSGLPAQFSPDGSILCAPDGVGGILLEDLAHAGGGSAGAQPRSQHIAAHAGELTCIRFSPDGGWLATGGRDRRVVLWRIHAGGEGAIAEASWKSEPFEAPRYDLDAVFDLTFDPSGPRLAAAFQSLDFRIFALEDGKCLATGHSATLGGLAFSRDGKLLFGAGKWINSSLLWRVEHHDGVTSAERVPLGDSLELHHTNSLTALVSAAGVNRLATGSLDRTARVWDLDRAECVASYAGHTDAVWDVDISADGARIVTASADGTARLWPGDVLAVAKRVEPAALAATFGALPMPKRRE